MAIVDEHEPREISLSPPEPEEEEHTIPDGAHAALELADAPSDETPSAELHDEPIAEPLESEDETPISMVPMVPAATDAPSVTLADEPPAVPSEASAGPGDGAIAEPGGQRIGEGLSRSSEARRIVGTASEDDLDVGARLGCGGCGHDQGKGRADQC